MNVYRDYDIVNKRHVVTYEIENRFILLMLTWQPGKRRGFRRRIAFTISI